MATVQKHLRNIELEGTFGHYPVGYKCLVGVSAFPCRELIRVELLMTFHGVLLLL